MAKVSKKGQGKALYIELSIYPCGGTDPRKNLTVSCPGSDTQFKTNLSDKGLKKFRDRILSFYAQHVLGK